ncbi:MAG: D-ribose pyranase [Chitinophagales bacterium]
MKNDGILNPLLLQTIGELGHTDTLAVADAGLPIPAGVRRIDLSVVPGLPGFSEVLAALLPELALEEAVAAEEIVQGNPELYAKLISLLAPVPLRLVPHSALKALLPATKGVVRTGECSPYANVILRCGVNTYFQKAR